MNASEMLTAMGDMMRDENFSHASGEEYLDYAHEAECELMGELHRNDYREFVRVAPLLSTVSATQEYGLPQDFLSVDSVRIKAGSVYYNLRHISQMRRFLLEMGANAFGANSNSAWSIRGNRIAFHPIPSSVETIRIEYVATPCRLYTGKFASVTRSGGFDYATLTFSVPANRPKIANDLQNCALQILSGTLKNDVAAVLSITKAGRVQMSGFASKPNATSWALRPDLPEALHRAVVIGGCANAAFKRGDMTLRQNLRTEFVARVKDFTSAFTDRTRGQPLQQEPNLNRITYD